MTKARGNNGGRITSRRPVRALWVFQCFSGIARASDGTRRRRCAGVTFADRVRETGARHLRLTPPPDRPTDGCSGAARGGGVPTWALGDKTRAAEGFTRSFSGQARCIKKPPQERDRLGDAGAVAGGGPAAPVAVAPSGRPYGYPHVRRAAVHRRTGGGATRAGATHRTASSFGKSSTAGRPTAETSRVPRPTVADRRQKRRYNRRRGTDVVTDENLRSPLTIVV